MKNSIETMWKEGFLNEKSLVAPKVNDLYNQKSMHLIDKMMRMFKTNLTAIIIMSITILVIYYFLDVFWLGLAASVLLLLTAWYSKQNMRGIKDLDPGANSFEYLKSFDRWLKDSLRRNEKIVRFSYPVYFIIACLTIVSAWNKQEELVLKVQQDFPDLLYVGGVPLFVLVIMGVVTLLMFFFSDKIYRWDVRLVYGRVFNKLSETLADMQQLK